MRNWLKIITVAILIPLPISAQKHIEITEYSEKLLLQNPPTTACHAATLVETSKGHIMAAWFGGSYEGAKDVGIYVCNIFPTVESPQKIIKPFVIGNDTLPCWNPVLFKSQSNILYLFFKVGKNPREWKGYMITSQNNGKTWSTHQSLPEGFLGPVKNKPIEVSKGIIICPSSIETINDNQWLSHIELFNELTQQWTKTAITSTQNYQVIQPTLLQLGGDSIQALMRSKHNRIIESWSYDGGKSWELADTLSVLNSNSGIDAVRLNNHFFLLVNNPQVSGKDWFMGRNTLELAISENGKDWKHLLELEHEPKGEFSYPAIIEDSNKKIHIIYTYNRLNFKYIQLSLSNNQ